jgi:hypothetical protein
MGKDALSLMFDFGFTYPTISIISFQNPISIIGLETI